MKSNRGTNIRNDDIRLETIGLSEGNRIQIVLFTKRRKIIDAHYDLDVIARGEFKCNGIRCAACAAGITRRDRILLPVYDVDTETFKLFLFTAREKPNMLWFKLRRSFKHNKPPFCLEIEGLKYGDAKLYLRDYPVKGKFPRKKARRFMNHIKSGRVDDSSIIKTITNNKLQRYIWAVK